MKKSETIVEIAKALITFKNEVGKLKRTATNPFFKSSYSPISEVIEALHKPLISAGLSFLQFPKGENELETIVMHTSGEWISESYYMKPVKEDPQAFGSVITYQRRYALCAIFGLGDEDDDANKVSEPTKQSDERPWLSKAQLDTSLERIKTEEEPAEFVKKIEDTYRMKKYYREVLTDALKRVVDEKQDKF